MRLEKANVLLTKFTVANVLPQSVINDEAFREFVQKSEVWDGIGVVRSHHYSIMHKYINRLIIESQEVTVASSTSTKQSDEPYGTWSVTELNPGDCVTCIIMYVLQGVISFLTAHQYN